MISPWTCRGVPDLTLVVIDQNNPIDVGDKHAWIGSPTRSLDDIAEMDVSRWEMNSVENTFESLASGGFDQDPTSDELVGGCATKGL